MARLLPEALQFVWRTDHELVLAVRRGEDSAFEQLYSRYRRRIWTYDFPDNQVQAIAIDPKQVAITRTISGLGKGPGHSLVVLPDKKTAAINVAGDDLIAFLDLEAGQVKSTLKTGAFP